MAMISDLLFQLAGSCMAEDEIALELRTDLGTVRSCLQRLGALAIIEGPAGDERVWAAIPADAPFDVLVGKAKAGGLDVRQPLPQFGLES